MMNNTHRKFNFILLAALSLAACDQPASDQNSSTPSSSASLNVPDLSVQSSNVAPPPTTRSYTAEQVSLGEQVFQTHCQICHGVQGVGEAEDWQKSRDDGTFPAPPLNGTAHTWHHSTKVLLGTIDRGGIPLGGRMPAFEKMVSKQEKLAVLAYIQSLWPDEIYQAWLQRDAQN